MLSLLLAILTSAMIAVIMRLSTDRVSGRTGMLAVNYFVCLLLAAMHTGVPNLIPLDPGLPGTMGMGLVNGFLFLAGFVLLQSNTKRNGVVLSSIFMKLGLLVPMVISMAKIFEEVGTPSLSAQFLFYTFVVAFLLCLGLAAWKKEKCGVKELLFGLALGVPNFYSARFLLASMKTVPAVIAYPTFSVGTILMVTLAGVVLFKERLAKRQWIALVMILLALALLNL